MQGPANHVLAAAGNSPGARRASRKLHGYFLIFTLIVAGLVLDGFSRTFFIPGILGTLSKPLVVHIHAAMFFVWIALLVSQTMLAMTKRLRMHRMVGSFAGWLILPMLLSGAILATRSTLRDFDAGKGDAALAFFYGVLADLAMFGVLAGGAMLLRSRPEYHKRWVLLGSLGLLGAAVGRIPDISSLATAIFLALAASMPVYDVASRRAIHPATGWGVAALLLIGLSEDWIGNSALWLGTAHHLLKL